MTIHGPDTISLGAFDGIGFRTFQLRVRNLRDVDITSITLPPPHALEVAEYAVISWGRDDSWTLTDRTVIEWRGDEKLPLNPEGNLRPGDSTVVNFAARLIEAIPQVLTFHVTLDFAGGTRERWDGPPGSERPAPRLTIVGPSLAVWDAPTFHWSRARHSRNRGSRRPRCQAEG